MFSRLGRLLVRLLRAFGAGLGRAGAERGRTLVVLERAVTIPDVATDLQPFADDILALRDSARGRAVARIQRLDGELERLANARLRSRVEGDRNAVLHPALTAVRSAVAPPRGPTLVETLLWRSPRTSLSDAGD